MSDVTMKRFADERLNNMDVMQHVRRIYDILGTTDREGVDTSKESVVEKLNNTHRGSIQWIGTKAEYDEAKAAGLIPEDAICAITDDYYNPYSK